jgi:hypothetical protein
MARFLGDVVGLAWPALEEPACDGGGAVSVTRAEEGSGAAGNDWALIAG